MVATRHSLVLLVVAGVLAACSGASTETAPPPTAPATDVAEPEGGASADTGAADVRQPLDEVPPLHPSIDGYPQAVVDLVAPDGVVWRLPVLVAATSADRAHGLMEVEDLPRGTGMVFVFGEDVTGGFWMKNTLVPLDIVYVDDGRPVSSTTMVPCEADPCPSYAADGPYDTALEVPAGFLDEVGFSAAWRVDLHGA